jgi:hypothetical protein
MTMQSDQQDRPSFFHTAGGQTTVLAIALVAIIAIAWFYFL